MSQVRRGAGSVHGAEVWLLDLLQVAQSLLDVEAVEPRLAAEDEVRLAAGSDAAARRERRAAHIALRLLLERAFGRRWRGVAFRISEHGRPSLPGAQGSFSLAHTAGHALVGIALDGPIGVDIERERDVRMSADRRRDIEAAAAAACPDGPLPREERARFLQAWVRLEALGKAQGEGVGPILNALRPAPLPSRGSPAGGAPGMAAFATLRVHDLGLGAGLHGAAAVNRGAAAPAVLRFPSTRQGIDHLLD